MTDRTVLVVGAGPVGLTMAAELARFGLNVRIIDRSPEPTHTSKALVVWSRTLELMDRMGCTASFLSAGLRATAAAMRNGHDVLGRTTFDSVPGAYPFALMIPQRDTERLLAEHLATFGVAVEREVTLDGFTDGPDGVEARLSHADGTAEMVHTPWLVGCDGAHSTVRKALALDFHGSTQGDEWLLADVRLEGAGVPAQTDIAVFLHNDGPFVIFPMPGGRSRIVGTRGKAAPGQPLPDPVLADVQAMADARAGGGFRVTDPEWLSNFRINERKVTEYRKGHVFLAGDAAHIHSPAGGQGMNTGMQDAINLSWKLAMVEGGGAAPGLLDSYTPERNAVGEMVLRNATVLTALGTLASPAAKRARNVALRFALGFHAVRNRMAATMSETEIAYPRSPLSEGLHAGDRFDPASYAGPPPGSGRSPRFVLFAADADRGRALAARFPGLLDPGCRPPPDPRRMLIVRPDGYVGLSARADRWQRAERYLHRIAAGPAPG